MVIYERGPTCKVLYQLRGVEQDEAATPTPGHFESGTGGTCGLHEGIAGWGGPGGPHGGNLLNGN